MFKSIKWKLVAVLVLVVVSLTMIVGTFFRISVSNFYTEEFTREIEIALHGDLGRQLGEAGNHQQFEEIIEAFSVRLGLDTYRFCAVLDGKTASVVFSSDYDLEKNIIKTDNLISALGGKEGNKRQYGEKYMDYAYPISENDEVKYVVYIYDSKVEVGEILDRILFTILEALFFGFVIALLFGYFLSGTISSPIANLTRKAEHFATGNFETKISVRSHDEIGKLSDTFNYMAQELKTNITALSDEKEKLESILRYMTDGVMAFDRSGNVLHINKAAARMFKIAENENISFNEFFKPLVSVTIEEIYFKNKSGISRDFQLDGKSLKAFFVVTGLDKSLKHQSGVIAVIHDNTELEKLEMNRREFVANVSHELKTPLTTVKSYAETILSTDGIPKEMLDNFLSTIISEADRMNRLVHDLLLLSKLNYNNNKLEKDPVDLRALIGDILRRMHLAMQEKNQELLVSIPDNLPLVAGSRDKLEQVFVNIISNAVKYTDDNGTVTVYAGQMYDYVFVKVIDTGVGIPEEDLPFIFDRFYRVDKARSREAGGTGLGLAIAKEIVEAHGGKISVSSKVGEGTEFAINLPVYTEETENKEK